MKKSLPSTQPDSTCLYREEQRFNQWWINVIVGAVAVIPPIELLNGKRILIGSQRAEELARVIREGMKRGGLELTP